MSQALRRQAVVRDFSCRILRGDKRRPDRPQRRGKTTLLRLILGELAPDAGRCASAAASKWPTSTSSAAQLDGATLADVISPGSDYVEIGGSAST
jgi:ATP-binding cassette subfamily F protein uup